MEVHCFRCTRLRHGEFDVAVVSTYITVPGRWSTAVWHIRCRLASPAWSSCWCWSSPCASDAHVTHLTFDLMDLYTIDWSHKASTFDFRMIRPPAGGILTLRTCLLALGTPSICHLKEGPGKKTKAFLKVFDLFVQCICIICIENHWNF